TEAQACIASKGIEGGGIISTPACRLLPTISTYYVKVIIAQESVRRNIPQILDLGGLFMMNSAGRTLIALGAKFTLRMMNLAILFCDSIALHDCQTEALGDILAA
ncbi:MAG TPA: hypothetical protein VG271_02980, partial [Beijerinckiaceae bacterium]|nr:hypothetical protein [Beijerinckiaceae bacterium]